MEVVEAFGCVVVDLLVGSGGVKMGGHRVAPVGWFLCVHDRALGAAFDRPACEGHADRRSVPCRTGMGQGTEHRP
jgi:hypothetical protein